MKVYVNYSLFDQEIVLIAANDKMEDIKVLTTEFIGDFDMFENNTYLAEGLNYYTTEPCIINI